MNLENKENISNSSKHTVKVPVHFRPEYGEVWIKNSDLPLLNPAFSNPLTELEFNKQLDKIKRKSF